MQPRAEFRDVRSVAVDARCLLVNSGKGSEKCGYAPVHTDVDSGARHAGDDDGELFNERREQVGSGFAPFSPGHRALLLHSGYCPVASF